MYIKKCENNTFSLSSSHTNENKENCLPNEEITDRLNGAFMNILHTDYDINIKDPNKIMKPYLNNRIGQLTDFGFKNYYYEINDVVINTDNNVFLNNNIEEKGYKFSALRESMQFWREHPIIPNTFTQINFICPGDTKIYTRIYHKLLKVITQIGGFSNGIIFSAQIIMFLYSSNIILWHCIFIVLSNHEIKDKLNENNGANHVSQNYSNNFKSSSINKINIERDSNINNLNNFNDIRRKSKTIRIGRKNSNIDLNDNGNDIDNFNNEKNLKNNNYEDKKKEIDDNNGLGKKNLFSKDYDNKKKIRRKFTIKNK